MSFHSAQSFVYLFISIVMLAAPAIADESAEDEGAIRIAIQTYVDAYNRGDAKGVAALWSETGEWVTPRGDRVRGRAAIEAEMKSVFAAESRGRLEVVDTNIRVIAPDVALEEGTARVVREGESSEASTYQAVHVKRAGKWQLESVREVDSPAATVADNRLAGLVWMVGEWVDRSPESNVETKVEWSLNQRFLVSHFSATFPGMEPLTGSQVIGYDAATGTIRSWLFDADGTIGEGTWTHDGKQWIVKSTQVLGDGRRASSTNIYSPHDANRYSWKSIGRKVDGEFLPNIDEVVVVRKGSEVASPVNDATTSPTSTEVSPAKE